MIAEGSMMMRVCDADAPLQSSYFIFPKPAKKEYQ